MIQLKKVGEKPLVDESGLRFDMKKRDQFDFIEPIANIALAFLGQELSKKMRIFPNEILNHDTIINTLQRVSNSFEDDFARAIKSFSEKLKQELEKLRSQSDLSEKERQTLTKNYEYMEDYRIQRKINQMVFDSFHAFVLESIIKNKIQELQTPFSSTFLHVLYAIKSDLENKNASFKIDIEVELKEENPYSRMIVRD